MTAVFKVNVGLYSLSVRGKTWHALATSEQAATAILSEASGVSWASREFGGVTRLVHGDDVLGGTYVETEDR